ncbi:sensor histidine kinase [Microscilla marina]|nr:sensor histidine kinase [Microscilla marina]
MAQSGELGVGTMLLIGTVGMLLLAMAVIVFFLVYQRRLLAQQEQLQQIKIEQQKALLEASLQTQENERRRIAKDLHDEVGANLSTINLFAKQIEKFVERESKAGKMVGKTKDLIATTITSVRTISKDLLPATLDRFGLVEAAKELCDRINQADAVLVNFEHQVTEERLSQPQELALFRIIQELFNNTLKHAQATQVNLFIHYTPKSLKIIFKDNGVGFDANALMQSKESTKGLGLKNLESRAQVLGASLNYTSPPEGGTQVNILSNTA